MFINTLYQRAVADHCLEVALWKEYLTYLVREGGGREGGEGGRGGGREGRGEGVHLCSA